MTDKLSQVTEEDVLSAADDQEHTLGGMTEDDTENQTQTAGGTHKGKSGKKGGGKNAILIIGIAAAVAVGLAVAYFTLVKKTPAPKAKNVVKKEAPKQEETPKQAPVVDSGFPSDTSSKESQTAADFLTREATPIAVINEVAAEVNTKVETPVLEAPVSPVLEAPAVVAPSAPVLPVAPVLETPAVVAPSAPVVLEPVVPVVVPVEAPATVQDTSINSVFDSIATRVDSISTRVDGLEKFKSAQEGLNTQFEKRIERLEGFHEGDKACNCDNSEKKPVLRAKKSTGTVAPVSGAIKHNHGPKPAPKKVAKPKTNIDGDVLVDKSSQKAIAEAKKPAPLEEYHFHSIYDNRVWWRKSDGSLETATVGSRLPSGEVIKEINHDKFEVVTNKRTIRKN